MSGAPTVKPGTTCAIDRTPFDAKPKLCGEPAEYSVVAWRGAAVWKTCRRHAQRMMHLGRREPARGIRLFDARGVELDDTFHPRTQETTPCSSPSAARSRRRST